MIQAKIVADSRNEFGHRITTMVVTFPRFILAELNTHRMFSRNSASSRAIPFRKMLESVSNNPFIPMAWQKDHSGMQGTEYELRDNYIEGNTNDWLKARDFAIDMAKQMSDHGITKQLCNRLLEPFMWHTVIITATEWSNFFALRCPKYRISNGNNHWKEFRSKKDTLKYAGDLMDTGHHAKQLSETDWLLLNKGQAEIHMMALAEAMWDAYQESTPKPLDAGEWHIPFGDKIDYIALQRDLGAKSSFECEDFKIKIATAMCARVSYTVVGEEDKPANYNNDIQLHDRLSESGHWSPFEHIARCMTPGEIDNNKIVTGDNESWITESLGWSGNLKGFVQYRKTFQNENITNMGK